MSPEEQEVNEMLQALHRAALERPSLAALLSILTEVEQ